MIESRINKAQHHLTDTDYTILNYLIANKQTIQDMSIHEIADKAYVSSASIVRLAKKLDYSGFSEMKYSMKSESEENSAEFKSSLSLLEQDISDTLNLVSEQNLQPICQSLHEARKIYVYGTDWGEKMAADYLVRNFMACGLLIHQIPSTTEFMWTLDQVTDDDLVIIISFSGENSTVKRTIPTLLAKNVRILSITPLSGNYLASHSTHRLYYKLTQLDIHKTTETEYNFYTSLNVLTEFLFRYYNDYYYKQR